MIANVLIGGLIFGYAGWVLWRYFSKSKEGKCASCPSKESCPLGANSCETGKYK